MTLIVRIVFVGLVLAARSNEEKRIFPGDSHNDFLQKRLIRALVNYKLNIPLRDAGSNENNHKSTYFNMNGFASVIACSLVVSATLLGGCLFCPNWRLKSNHVKTPEHVGSIDLKNISTNCSNDCNGQVLQNSSVTLDKAVSKILADSMVAHSNPCFSLDEPSGVVHCRPQLPLPQVHSAQVSRVPSKPRRVSRTGEDQLIYENKHFHANSRTGARQRDCGHASGEVSVLKCSEKYNLFGFYDNTEYLTGAPAADKRITRELRLQARRTLVLRDLSNFKKDVSKFEERGNARKPYSVNHSYRIKMNYDMNDVAFKNLYAK